MSSPWTASCTAFADAADWFVRAVGEVGDRWAEPGLGEWDVRSLVGHTSRGLITVESYLSRPATSIDVGSARDYFRTARGLVAGSEVAARGREAGDALGADPAAAVAAIAARVVPAVTACDGSELLTTVLGGMSLRDYLPTRTFELVVHTADLATALNLPLEVPAAAARESLGLVAELAAGTDLAGPLLLAATGRQGLPPGFTIL